MLILIAHGSRNPNWRASVEKLTAELQNDVGPDRVRLAYMECAPPTLADVAAEAVRAGVRRIRVLPLFLTAEGHVIKDIEPMVAEARRTHPSVDVELLPPVGRHRLFREMLAVIATQADD